MKIINIKRHALNMYILFYFCKGIDFNKTKSSIQMMKPRLGMTARTGEKCPKSGVWKVLGTAETITQSISRGNRMPQSSNRGVTWKLIVMF